VIISFFAYSKHTMKPSDNVWFTNLINGWGYETLHLPHLITGWCHISEWLMGRPLVARWINNTNCHFVCLAARKLFKYKYIHKCMETILKTCYIKLVVSKRIWQKRVSKATIVRQNKSKFLKVCSFRTYSSSRRGSSLCKKTFCCNNLVYKSCLRLCIWAYVYTSLKSKTVCSSNALHILYWIRAIFVVPTICYEWYIRPFIISVLRLTEPRCCVWVVQRHRLACSGAQTTGSDSNR